MRKELAGLFGSPIAYAALIGVCVVTAIVFFEYLHFVQPDALRPLEHQHQQPERW